MNTQEFIDNLTSKWNTYSKKQKQEVAVSVAGKFSYSRVNALINQSN